MDLNFDKIRLLRTDMEGELIIDDTITSLDGVYLRDKIEIKNGSTVYRVPNSFLKLYANTIYIDATSNIIANESGYTGGHGGNLGAGPGFGRYGDYGAVAVVAQAMQVTVVTVVWAVLIIQLWGDSEDRMAITRRHPLFSVLAVVAVHVAKELKRCRIRGLSEVPAETVVVLCS